MKCKNCILNKDTCRKRGIKNNVALSLYIEYFDTIIININQHIANLLQIHFKYSKVDT